MRQQVAIFFNNTMRLKNKEFFRFHPVCKRLTSFGSRFFRILAISLKESQHLADFSVRNGNSWHTFAVRLKNSI
jgi:hypothetical protein